MEMMFDISSKGSSYKVLGRSYSGPEGTVQVFGVASETLYPGRKKSILHFVSSLEFENQ